MPTAWGFLYVSPEKSISSRNTSDRTTLYISPPPAQSALAEPEGEARAAARLRQRLAVGAWRRRPPVRSAATPRRHLGRAAAPRRRPPTSTWWRARARRRWGARRGTRRALARSAISTGTHVSARFARNHGAGGRGAGGGAGGAGRRKSARMGGGAGVGGGESDAAGTTRLVVASSVSVGSRSSVRCAAANAAGWRVQAYVPMTVKPPRTRRRDV